MKKQIFLAIFSFIITSNYVQAQNLLEKLSKSKLYVVIDEKAHPKNSEYAEVFKNYWELSEVEIIDPNEMSKYYKKDIYFATIIVQMEEGLNTEKYANRFLYSIDFWEYNPKKIEKFKDKVENDEEIDMSLYKIDFASIKILKNKSMKFSLNNILNGEYFGGKYNMYGGIGMLKNAIQLVQLNIKKNEKGIAKTKNLNNFNRVNVLNKEELISLKSDVLYIPKPTMFDLEKNNYLINIKDVFEEYPWQYQLIALDSLNEKIMNEKKAIYYLIRKYDDNLEIINGQTGEIIYEEIAAYTTFCRLTSKKIENIIEFIGGKEDN
ncbi:MAG: hypothetical protein ACOYO1_01255 [Bacteroidales bacterium]